MEVPFESAAELSCFLAQTALDRVGVGCILDPEVALDFVFFVPHRRAVRAIGAVVMRRICCAGCAGDAVRFFDNTDSR